MSLLDYISDSLFSIYFSNCFRILGLWVGLLSIYLACSLALGFGSWMLFHKLKNKTTVKKKRDCYINTKETTILTNKIKLLVLKLSFQKTMFLTNKNSLRQLYNIIRNSVKTLIFALLALFHTRQGNNHLKVNIIELNDRQKQE